MSCTCGGCDECVASQMAHNSQMLEDQYGIPHPFHLHANDEKECHELHHMGKHVADIYDFELFFKTMRKTLQEAVWEFVVVGGASPNMCLDHMGENPTCGECGAGVVEGHKDTCPWAVLKKEYLKAFPWEKDE